MGEELTTFQEMGRLYDQEDWAALRDLCEQQRKKTPKWLTPSLYAGVAYARLGEVEKAIERLDYVIKEAGDNSDYDDARREREELRQKFGR